jgi:hypothetical protein
VGQPLSIFVEPNVLDLIANVGKACSHGQDTDRCGDLRQTKFVNCLAIDKTCANSDFAVLGHYHNTCAFTDSTRD